MMTWGEREVIVQQCREETVANGLSIKQWCNARGLSVKTFYSWKRRTNGGISDDAAKGPMKQKTEKTQKHQWAMLPVGSNNTKNEDDQSNNNAAIYKITYGGFTVSISNELKTETLIEILRAVKHTCC